MRRKQIWNQWEKHLKCLFCTIICVANGIEHCICRSVLFVYDGAVDWAVPEPAHLWSSIEWDAFAAIIFPRCFHFPQLWKSSNNIVFVLETSVWRCWSKSQLRIKTVQLLTWNSYLISRYQWIPTIRQIVVERFGMNGLNFGVIWRQQSGPSGAQAYYGESIGSIEALWPFMVVPHQKHFMANYRSLAANHW